MGMSPTHVQRVMAPLAAPNTSSHLRVLSRLLQSAVMLAVAPESGEAAMRGNLVSKLFSTALMVTLANACCEMVDVKGKLSAPGSASKLLVAACHSPTYGRVRALIGSGRLERNDPELEASAESEGENFERFCASELPYVVVEAP